tara:strand:+ start:172 stop:819 length:648 start_codon:yes stop_codon:yes gene_type:complete
MKVKKFGHCCLLIEDNGVKILTDPGGYTDLDVVIKEALDLDAILITHEHADHIHISSLKKILESNPETRVITNKSVSKLLEAEEIKHEVMENNTNLNIKEILIEAIEGKHETIYADFGDVQNTGFFINNKLFYPGDSFHNPEKEVDILALPVAGPWCKISDAVDYALKVKPKKAFPVHDGMLSIKGGNHAIPSKFLSENGIDFVIINEGDTYEFE